MNINTEYQQFKRAIKLNRLLFAIFAYVATILVYNFGVLQPMKDNYKELKERKREIEDLYIDTRALDMDELIQKLSFQREDLIYQIEGIEGRLVPAIEKKIVWTEIQNLAKKNDLTVLSFTNQEDRDQKLSNMTKQFLKIKLNGQFYKFINFLLDLDEFRYLVLVHDFKITNNIDADKNLNIHLEIYIFVSEN